MNRPSYMRPRKAAAFEAIRTSLEHKSGLRTEVANNVVLTPRGQVPAPFPKTRGQFIVDDNDFITEMLPCETGVSDFKLERLDGRTLYGGWLRKIWGHFLMGGLARMWVTTLSGFLDKVDYVLFFSKDFEGALHGNYLEIMRLLGVADKMVIAKCAIEAEELIIPEISFEHDRFNSEECKATFDFIRRSALADMTEEERKGSPKKLFLTRSGLKNAQLDEVNLWRLDRMFADNGYEVIAPEQLSVTQLIRMFDGASEIASVGGSTAHNFVFASPKDERHYIVMERHATPNTFQINIDDMSEISPDYVDAFYMPGFSSSQDRTVLFAMTPQLKAFVRAMGWNDAAFGNYDSVKERRRELRQYLRRHRRYFGNSESIEPWETDCAPVLAEAVLETRERYWRWLQELRPLLWYDYLTPRFYLRAIKRLISHR